MISWPAGGGCCLKEYFQVPWLKSHLKKPVRLSLTSEMLHAISIIVFLLSLRSHFYFFLNSNNFHLKTCIFEQFFIYLHRTCYRTGSKVIKFVHLFLFFLTMKVRIAPPHPLLISPWSLTVFHEIKYNF